MRRKSNMKNVLAAVLVGAACGTLLLTTTSRAQASVQKDAAKDKAVKIGDAAPNFKLTSTDGKEVSLEELKKENKIIVLEWFNPKCPYVVKHHSTFTTMKDTHSQFEDDIIWLAINSGAPGKQGHGLELNKQKKIEYGIKYPVLIDESGEVGRMYQAKKTPHMYVIDASGNLAYMGAIDNDRSPNQQGDVNYVKDAIQSLLAGETVDKATTKAYGCGVKYAR